jgi:glycosyltransferase involved in cell wall biosynthesis
MLRAPRNPPDALRVAMLTDYPFSAEDEHLGGIMQASLRLVAALDRLDGIALTVVTLSTRVAARVQRQLPGGTRIVYLPFRRGWLHRLNLDFPWIAARLLREVVRCKAQLVHGQGIPHYILVALFGSRPHMVTVHGIYRNESQVADSRNSPLHRVWRRLKVAVEWLYMGRIRNLIAITDEVVRIVTARSPAVRVHPVNNPIDDAFFAITPVPAAGPPVVLCVATITFRKGVDYLLEAFEQVLSVLPEARLRIAGIWDHDPTYGERLRSQYAHRLAREEVLFLGGIPQAQLLQEMQGATLLCLPSRAESAPMTIAQAMAAGRPVVASNVGGIPAMVADEQAGCLSNVGDVAKLAADMVRLLSDRQLAQRMGENGRSRAASRYGSESVAAATVAAYRATLPEGPLPRLRAVRR